MDMYMFHHQTHPWDITGKVPTLVSGPLRIGTIYDLDSAQFQNTTHLSVYLSP